MNDSDPAQIILACATLVASIGGVIVSIRNSRGIEHVKRATNGVVAALVTKTELAAKVEGRAEGVEAERDRIISGTGNAATKES